jgi:hypothetical protein
MGGTALRCLAAGAGLSACAAAGLALAPPALAADTKEIVVASTRTWTPTPVSVRQGDRIGVEAAGRIHFGARPIDAMEPAGIPWGRPCDAIANRQGRASGWPARGLACWSLIGRIGDGPPFAIGAARTVTAPAGGPLQLGVNDNHLADNRGSWTVTVSVGGVSAGGPGADEGSGGGSPLPFVAVAVGLAGGLAVLVLLLRRRRPAGQVAPAEAVPADQVAAAPAPAHAPAPYARPEGDLTEVNIFDVQLDRDALHVGYNFFPEGTEVRWRIRHGAVPLAAGGFVAEGGGPANHFVTLAIEPALEPNGVADVEFAWLVGDVPFHYVVKRAPRS